MPDSPYIEKVGPRLVERVNAYGASYPADPPDIDSGVDLVEEIARRGIETDADDHVEQLRDPVVWPDATRSTLLHLVQAAESEGVRFSIEYDHLGSGESASAVVSMLITLRGP